MNHYFVAKYLRLSKEDDNNFKESNSIRSQRDLIDEFIEKRKQPNWVTREYIDDGYTGTNFDRPQFKKMLDDVRTEKVNCIIVKDFSRFGRNLLECCEFIEHSFPYMGIRFISLGDGYDSKYSGAMVGLDVPIRNLINDTYSKDLSKKLKTAKKTQMRMGKFKAAEAIFGYTKDSEGWSIDREAADIVRGIFASTHAGNSNKEIASKLNKDGVPTPMRYKKSKGLSRDWHTVDKDNNHWTPAAVLRIIRDERYTSTYIAGKWEAGKLGNKKNRRLPESEWVKLPNHHEAIISDQLYNELNDKKTTQNNRSTFGENRVLYKKVRCGECNHLLYRKDGSEPFYFCNTPRMTEEASCFTGKIPEKNISNTILMTIQTYAKLVADTNKIYNQRIKDYHEKIADNQKHINKIKGDMSRIVRQKMYLYQSFKDKKIGKDAYMQRKASFDDKANEFAEQLEKHNDLCEQLADKCNQDDINIIAIKKYEFFSELSREIVDELIGSVIVHNESNIKIVLNFADEFEKILNN